MVAQFAQSVGLAVVFAVLVVAQSAPGKTTRYWDCCKPSCAWSGKADVLQPVQTCDSGGNKLVDPNAASGCGGGQAFTCVDNQPWAIDDNLAYGFAAVHLTGSNEAQWCCQCYELTFTSGPAVGKRLVVQATNTGGDLGENHFDLLIPGGGVGLFNGCPAQFGSWDGGQQYGGVGSRAECDQLPESVRAGCYFRFDWFMNSDNPSMDFKQVACPAELTQKSGCMRSDASGPAPEPTPEPVPEPVPAPEPQPGTETTITITETVTDTVTKTQTVTETVTGVPAPAETTAEPPVDDGDNEVPCDEELETSDDTDGEEVDSECPTEVTEERVDND